MLVQGHPGCPSSGITGALLDANIENRKDLLLVDVVSERNYSSQCSMINIGVTPQNWV